MSNTPHSSLVGADEFAKLAKLTKLDAKQTKREACLAKEQASNSALSADIDEIQRSQFRSVEDRSLTLEGDFMPATAKTAPLRENRTELDFFEDLLGALIRERIMPQLNARLTELAPSRAKAQQRRYQPADYREAAAYFLDYFLEGVRQGSEKAPSDEVIAGARADLIGETRSKVFNTALEFGDEVLGTIVDAVPIYIIRLIALGGCVTIDEAIWAYHSPNAKSKGKLRHIPAKPHQDGILTYVLCQRLKYSERPIAVAFAPTFLARAPTPRDALMKMVAALEQAGVDSHQKWSLIADSLWSYPSYVSEFMVLGWRFVVSAKDNATMIPQALRKLAASDLVLGNARTYTDGFITLQVHLSERGTTTVITNAAQQNEEDSSGPLPLLSYKTALSLFLHDSPGGIIRTFNLSNSCLTLRKAALVHDATGWDVLREPTHQGDTTALTQSRLNKFKRQQVLDIYKDTFPTQATAGLSKEQMIQDLCPEEEAEKARRTSKRKLDAAALKATMQELQGKQSTEHRIYDIFHQYYACIDQLDREFYQHGRVRYVHGINHLGLCCTMYYLFITCHAMYDEHNRELLFARSRGNNAQVLAWQAPSIVNFLLAVVAQFKSKYPRP